MAWWRAWALALVAGQLPTASGAPEASLRGARVGSEHEAFLDELHKVLGSGSRRATEASIKRIEAGLAVTFRAMPKGPSGRLSAASARYAVHRYFVKGSGWRVKGIAPNGDSWKPSSSVLGMGEHLPEQLQRFLDSQFGREDYDLKGLVLLTASIEAYIHGEAEGRLHNTYRALGLDPAHPVEEEVMIKVIYSYITGYLYTFSFATSSGEQLEASVQKIEQQYPRLKPETMAIIHAERQRLLPSREAYSFEEVETVSERVQERFGHRVDERRCRIIEDRLEELQDPPHSGLVPLMDLYRTMVKEHKTGFSERPEYLQTAGVLDESNPSMPSVIIPNYVGMLSNCLNSSAYYDVCCRSHCEDLFDQVQDRLRAASAPPDVILQILSKSNISNVHSPHHRANGTWSEGIVQKLRDVATHHGGEVPLHGRLFSQWLHFAYPMSCPYPNPAGTSRQLSLQAWVAETGSAVGLKPKELAEIVNSSRIPLSASKSCDDAEGGTCRWVNEEEMVDGTSWALQLAARTVPAAPERPVLSLAHSVASVAAVAVSIALMQRMMTRMTSRLVPESKAV